MASDLGPGTLLECISNKQNAKICDGAKSFRLTVGSLYIVDEVISKERVRPSDIPCEIDGCHGPFLMLKGKSGPIENYGCCCYCPSQFRPYGGSESVDRKEEITA